MATLEAQAELEGLRFEPNRGQGPAEALFLGRLGSGRILVDGTGFAVGVAEPSAVVLGPDPPDALPAEGARHDARAATPTSVHFFFADEPVRPQAAAPLAARAHYYSGAEENWLHDVPQYAQMRWPAIHPGIDVVLYQGPGGLEFDHIVSPGGDASLAGFRVDAPVQLLPDGALRIGTGADAFRLEAPYAYQDLPEGRVPVAASFQLDPARAGHVGYALGAYDAGYELVIDPILKFSTFAGAAGSEYGYAVAVVDPPAAPLGKRIIYVGGYDSSTSAFPPGFGSTITHGGGSYDGFVAKYVFDMNSYVATPEWYAYVGGGSYEYLQDLAADKAGNVYFTGYTRSDDLPIKFAIEDAATGYDGSVRSGSSWEYDAFVGMLAPDGSLGFSSYYGGRDYDYGRGVAYDETNQRVVLAGYGDTVVSGGYTIPQVNPIQAPGGGYDAFVAAFDIGSPRSSIAFSTWIGGGTSDYAYAVDADAFGIHLTGYTYSDSGYTVPYPTTSGAGQATTVGTSYNHAFATGLELDGSAMRYSTFLDGRDYDYGYGVVGDAAGGAWVTGYSRSTDFPTCPSSCPGGAAPALQSGLAGVYDAFAVHVSPTGGFLYATLIGGTSYDYGRGIALDSSGMVTIAGYTSSTGLATTASALYPARVGGYDGFVARFDPAAGSYEFFSYLGGTGTDYAYGLAADPASSNLYVVGMTSSTTFPTVLAVQATKGSGYDAFLTVIGKGAPRPMINASSFGYPTLSTPLATPYQVLTFEEIVVDGLGSMAGEFPLDMAKTEWTLSQGGTVIARVTGTLDPNTDPAWPVLEELDDTILRVCLTLQDNDPSLFDSIATACMDLEWLNRAPDATIIRVDPDPVQSTKPVVMEAVTSDMDGTVVAETWDFDGYGTATGLLAGHVFPWGSDGTRPITFTATDDDGASTSVIYNLRVEDGPLAQFGIASGPHLPGTAVDFTDASLAGNPLRPIWYWTWDFGDGTPPKTYQWLGGGHPAPVVSHAYAREGTYDVTLTVEDSKYSHSTTQQVTIRPKVPLPADDHYSTYQDIPLTVDAPGLLANDAHPMKYPLTVAAVTPPGSGTLTWHANGSFAYTPAPGFLGIETFTYTVTDGLITSGPATVTLVVSNVPPPLAAFTTDARGHAVVFHDTTTVGHYPLTAWHWDFGDGTTSNLQNPVHAFAASGIYRVSLHVTDAAPAPLGPLASSTVRLVFVAAVPGQPEPGSDPPQAFAGDDLQVNAGDSLVLRGSSDMPGVTWRWEQTGGPPVDLQGSESATPTFLAPPVSEPTEFVFVLRVHDSFQTSVADELRIWVHPANEEPRLVVDAPVRVDAGEILRMRAEAEDADGDTLVISWTQWSGPEVLAAPAKGANVEVPLPATLTGEVVFRVLVTDGEAEVAKLVAVHVGPLAAHLDARFDAVMGDAPGEVRFIDRSQGAGRSYWWDFGDNGPTSHATSPTHRYAQPGEYHVTLIVQDEQGSMATFSRLVTVPEAALSARGGADAAAGLDALQVEPPSPGSLADEEEHHEPAARAVPAPWAALAILGCAFMLSRRGVRP
jgi:PKD repeat protein